MRLSFKFKGIVSHNFGGQQIIFLDRACRGPWYSAEGLFFFILLFHIVCLSFPFSASKAFINARRKSLVSGRDLLSSAASKNVFQYQSRNYFTLLERLKSCHFSIRYSNNFPQFTASTGTWRGVRIRLRGCRQT